MPNTIPLTHSLIATSEKLNNVRNEISNSVSSNNLDAK